ncbi:MAG: hypothetical protein J0M10_01960 [Chitinophagales bacterium]|nr:hypothetical protein [Chitinophagales bacterium]
MTSICITILLSCTNQKIETGQTLKKETTDLIRSLGLLNEGEQIIQYYSNYKPSRAGSFFTTKRIAHYWLDDNDKSKNDTSSAFYPEIAAIDTTYAVRDTYAQYMTITKKDSSQFNLYVDGKKHEVRSFFEEAILTWKKNINKE